MSSQGSSNEENLFINTGILKECINVCAIRKLQGDYLEILFLKYVLQLDCIGFVMVTEKLSD